MSNFAIGDIQGCYNPLMQLLEHIQFDDRRDQLWFVGDLVNRGSQSLEVLRFIQSLSLPPKITLGNHDLYLLTCLFTENAWRDPKDSLQDILNAPDAWEIGQWLRKQPLILHDPALSVVLCHAGIAPFWDLSQAIRLAAEVEAELAGDNYCDFLSNMYGNLPDQWSEQLTGIARLRFIVNCFTRMRFLDAEGHLDFKYDATLEQAPHDLYPWFLFPDRKPIEAPLIFGHWAALKGICPVKGLYAIDTGCVWGGTLTALRLEDKQLFSVQGY